MKAPLRALAAAAALRRGRAVPRPSASRGARDDRVWAAVPPRRPPARSPAAGFHDRMDQTERCPPAVATTLRSVSKLRIGRRSPVRTEPRRAGRTARGTCIASAGRSAKRRAGSRDGPAAGGSASCSSATASRTGTVCLRSWHTLHRVGRRSGSPSSTRALGDTTGRAARLTGTCWPTARRLVVVALGVNDMLGRGPGERTVQNLRTITQGIRAQGAAVILLHISLPGVPGDGHRRDFGRSPGPRTRPWSRISSRAWFPGTPTTGCTRTSRARPCSRSGSCR